MATPTDSLEQVAFSASQASTLADGEVLAAPAVLPDGLADRPGQSSSFSRLLRRVAAATGLDRAIVFTVLARGWSSLAGLLTVFLIARFLSPAEQGYYYLFYALVALQMIFELGFSVVVLQTASHECAHLAIAPNGAISGPARPHARLASILQKAVRWYGCGALLLLVTLVPAGRYFFRTHAPGQASVAWVLPWSVVVLATVFTFQVDPIFSFLEGCGYVPEVARRRFGQAVAGSLLGWTALVTHHGLYAPGMIIGGQALVGMYAVWRRRGLLLPLLRMQVGDAHIGWRTEIWPFQWRVAVSWVCGYLSFQLFTPVLFKSANWGPVVAGRMGMAISIAGALSAVSVAWMNTKAAPFGRLIALREFRELDRVFFRSLAQSTAISLLGSASVWLGVVWLGLHHGKAADRVLAPLPFGLFLLAGVMNNVVFGMATYLRAHKQEKFMVNSILGAALVAPLVYLLGRPYGPVGITGGYCAVTLAVGLGLGSYTFLKYRRLWHG